MISLCLQQFRLSVDLDTRPVDGELKSEQNWFILELEIEDRYLMVALIKVSFVGPVSEDTLATGLVNYAEGLHGLMSCLEQPRCLCFRLVKLSNLSEWNRWEHRASVSVAEFLVSFLLISYEKDLRC